MKLITPDLGEILKVKKQIDLMKQVYQEVSGKEKITIERVIELIEEMSLLDLNEQKLFKLLEKIQKEHVDWQESISKHINDGMVNKDEAEKKLTDYKKYRVGVDLVNSRYRYLLKYFTKKPSRDTYNTILKEGNKLKTKIDDDIKLVKDNFDQA